MTTAVAWTCPTCDIAVASSFCPSCGEAPLDARDLTLRGLLKQLFKAFSNVDSRVIRSFFCLMARPGVLTLAYLQGRRKPYLGPIPLFLVTNVLYFAVQAMTDLKILSTQLDVHLHKQNYSELAQTLVTQHLQETQTTLSSYMPIFDQAMAVNGKTLIGLMVFPFALLPALIFRKNPHPFAVQVVFSLHFYAFLLLLLCLPIGAIALIAAMAGHPGGGTSMISQAMDDGLGIALATSCAIYLYVAIGKVYDARGVIRIIQTAVLTTAVVLIFMAYRFGLFLITLYTT